MERKRIKMKYSKSHNSATLNNASMSDSVDYSLDATEEKSVGG
jgi:hypothetical protein